MMKILLAVPTVNLTFWLINFFSPKLFVTGIEEKWISKRHKFLVFNDLVCLIYYRPHTLFGKILFGGLGNVQ